MLHSFIKEDEENEEKNKVFKKINEKKTPIEGIK